MGSRARIDVSSTTEEIKVVKKTMRGADGKMKFVVIMRDPLPLRAKTQWDVFAAGEQFWMRPRQSGHNSHP